MKSAAMIASEMTQAEIEERIAFWLDQPQSEAVALEVLSDALEIIGSRVR